jgi:hypothetical protein
MFKDNETKIDVKKYSLLIGILAGVLFGMILNAFFLSLGNERDIFMLNQRVKNLEIYNNIEYDTIDSRK